MAGKRVKGGKMMEEAGAGCSGVFDSCDIIERQAEPSKRKPSKKDADWPVHESDASLGP